MDVIRNWKHFSKPWIPMAIDGTIFVALVIVGILVPFIDYMAHVGGVVVGILSALFLCPNLHWDIFRDGDPVKPRLILMGISSVFLLTFFLGAFIGFFQTTSPTAFTVTWISFFFSSLRLRSKCTHDFFLMKRRWPYLHMLIFSSIMLSALTKRSKSILTMLLSWEKSQVRRHSSW